MNPESVYEFTLPVFIKMLGGLKGVLKKAGEHGLDEATLLNDKLAEDMFPLVKQVQVATDNAKGCAARLSGTENPKFEDTETTLAELDARIDKTVEYLKTFTKESFAGAEQVQATFPYFPGKFMPGFDYAREYAIPNFFFHVATAYAIVRKNGVQVGKADYINGLPLQDL
ncbi:MAG: DUF1993 domain-containing protein [Candidatus Adlerbacteria bacterium]